MAARRNNNNQKNQKAETEKIPESAEDAETGEHAKEPAEDPKSKDGQLLEKTKVLTAVRPILYLAKMYYAGERLPQNNQEMVAAWIEAGSAAWQESETKPFP